jgi:hypothetical protein
LVVKRAPNQKEKKEKKRISWATISLFSALAGIIEVYVSNPGNSYFFIDFSVLQERIYGVCVWMFSRAARALYDILRIIRGEISSLSKPFDKAVSRKALIGCPKLKWHELLENGFSTLRFKSRQT